MATTHSKPSTAPETCPSCDANRPARLVRELVKVDVRGEAVEVEDEFYRCPSCGEEFSILGRGPDTLARVYEIYRERHNYVRPGELRGARERHGYTQAQLAKLLGFGPTTLSRYENGALQDEAHDKLMRIFVDYGPAIFKPRDTAKQPRKPRRLPAQQQAPASAETSPRRKTS